METGNQGLVEMLRAKYFKDKTAIWKDVAEKLAKPNRRQVEVNISDIERNSAKDESVIIPGIVLSNGELTKPVNVAAWKFTPAAEKKIKDAKGKCMTIEQLFKDNPKGTGVRILT